MPRRRAVPAPAPAPGEGERTGRWAGLSRGDPVDVLDPRERGATWRFEAHVTNGRSGASWVEVVGGRGGEQRRRSFRPEQVFPHGTVRGTTTASASLADAPQLPL